MGVTVQTLRPIFTHKLIIEYQLQSNLLQQGVPFEEVMPKSGHEAFPCEGSKGGIWGLSTRIWGGLQPHKQLWATECLLSSLAPAAYSDHSSNRLAVNEMMGSAGSCPRELCSSLT